MHGLLIIIAALLALPLLFPEGVVRWRQAAQTWLETRRADQDREIVELEALIQTHDEWGGWLARLRTRRDEFEQLKNEVEDLRQEVAALKQRLAAA